MKRFLIFTAAVLLSVSAFSQKIAHLDRAALIKSMPESVEAEAKLMNAKKEYETIYSTYEAEYQQMVNDFQANQSTMPKAVLEIKVKAIQNKEQELMQFEQSASQDLQDQQNTLYTPIIEKADKAIADVAKANGYTYVIDSGLGVLLYAGGDDILDKVKLQLGIPLTPAPAPAPAPAPKTN